MKHTIENKFLSCAFSDTGGELRSLKDKLTGKEYIWQINPSVWRSSAPILFPSIGTIKDAIIKHKSNHFNMPKHGFIRDNEHLSFHKRSDHSCVFRLKHSSLTKNMYPFDFCFEVHYTLVDNCLDMTYSITNMDSEPLYFTCGGHTAYSVPIFSTRTLFDYVVEIPTSSQLYTHRLDHEGLLTANLEKISLNEGALQLSNHLFDNDALIFSAVDFDWVRLREKSKKKGIVVEFKNYPNLALWSKPGADYLCIEPWLGLPDSTNESLIISEKTTYKRLQPEENFKITISTKIE